MAIIETINDSRYFADWLYEARNRDSSYGNSFSSEGAVALQEYLEQLSDDIGENIEFDPIAWCVEFTEYDSYSEIWEQYGNGTGFIEGEELAIDDNIKQWLEERTTVIEFDGGVIIGEF